MMSEQAKAPQDLQNVAKFLRSKSGMKTRQGVLNGQRRDYFKGSSAIKALLSPSYAKLKSAPKVTNEQEAAAVLHSLIPFAFYLRVERGQATSSAKHSPKLLTITQQQAFVPTDYYVWFLEGSQVTTYLGGLAMVAVILAGVMFPLWPMKMRLGAWYLSMGLLGLLGLFFGIAILRLIFYIITWITVPPGIWVFPQLFADVGFVESFIPFYEWDLPKKKKGGKKRRSAKGEAAKGETSNAPAAEVTAEVPNGHISSPLPGMMPAAPAPSFARSRQAYIEEVEDEDA